MRSPGWPPPSTAPGGFAARRVTTYVNTPWIGVLVPILMSCDGLTWIKFIPVEGIEFSTSSSTGEVLVGRGPHAYWLHAKLVLVVGALGYHHACRSLLRKFEQFSNQRSERWLRVFNEAAVLLFTAIVVLVVVKPF